MIDVCCTSVLWVYVPSCDYHMTRQMSQLEKERAEQELQMKRLKQELHTAQLEMNKSATNLKDAQNQIQMLSKERGM